MSPPLPADGLKKWMRDNDGAFACPKTLTASRTGTVRTLGVEAELVDFFRLRRGFFGRLRLRLGRAVGPRPNAHNRPGPASRPVAWPAALHCDDEQPPTPKNKSRAQRNHFFGSNFSATPFMQ